MLFKKKIKLSVIVNFYNMRREAERTLLSLSRRYQRGIEDLCYEVIVIDNGSSEPLDEGYVQSFGEEFRYFYLEDAQASPAHALNVGASHAVGEYVAIMIDGAHILTPGVFAYFLLADKAFGEPVIVTKAWFLGPGQQGVTVQEGYNQAAEDQLLTDISWPNDGYRLFEIGEFVGTQNPHWFSGFKESNCLIVRNALYQQVGGANEAFDIPGGGFLNLDILKECTKVEGTHLVALLGEATFHQLHGGTTTNVGDQERTDRIQLYRKQYKEIRGEGYRLPTLPIQYIGHLGHHAQKRLPNYTAPKKRATD
jgi:glycosyltransferase involved in cell wall biosynthesis